MGPTPVDEHVIREGAAYKSTHPVAAAHPHYFAPLRHVVELSRYSVQPTLA